VRRGRLSDVAVRGAAFVRVRPGVRAAGDALRAGAFRAATVRVEVFRAGLLRAAVFFVPPFRAPFGAAALRLRTADFRVDFAAFGAPPRAVLRTGDLDRLLDDALRLAMSGILADLP
jgi:hypothetical protein